MNNVRKPPMLGGFLLGIGRWVRGSDTVGDGAIRSLPPGGRWIAKQDGRSLREIWYHKMTDTSPGAMAVL